MLNFIGSINIALAIFLGPVLSIVGGDPYWGSSFLSLILGALFWGLDK